MEKLNGPRLTLSGCVDVIQAAVTSAALLRQHVLSLPLSPPSLSLSPLPLPLSLLAPLSPPSLSPVPPFLSLSPPPSLSLSLSEACCLLKNWLRLLSLCLIRRHLVLLTARAAVIGSVAVNILKVISLVPPTSCTDT